MDDFGNDYQTMEWFMSCEQFMASMSTFGFADDALADLCIAHCIDYATVDI